MISDLELWRCAHQVLRQHGVGCIQFVADRIADLAAKGDQDGVATWAVIADRVDRLNDQAGSEQPRH